MDNFFSKLKVLELSSVLAGPAVGMFFAELGAQVTKIENKTTGGDVTRSWKMAGEVNERNLSAYYHTVNWNKETRFLDLANKTNRDLLDKLLAVTDILISNFKPGSAEKLKLDYPSLKTQFPQLILGTISAYGEKDPRPGFDALLQAETGWMHMNGQADGPPTKMPVALIDLLAAHQLKEGLLVALLERQQRQTGCHVSVSLYDTAIASLANQASTYLNLGQIPQRKGSQHPNIAPYGEIFYTRDSTPIILAVGTDKQFTALCQILELSELLDNPSFLTNHTRVENRTALYNKLSSAISAQLSTTLIAACNKAQVPVGEIKDLSQVFSEPDAHRLILEQDEGNGQISKRVKTKVFKISY